MSNFEYANATDDQLNDWAFAAYQEQQDFEYEERICRWYAVRGLHNVY